MVTLTVWQGSPEDGGDEGAYDSSDEEGEEGTFWWLLVSWLVGCGWFVGCMCMFLGERGDGLGSISSIYTRPHQHPPTHP